MLSYMKNIFILIEFILLMNSELVIFILYLVN